MTESLKVTVALKKAILDIIKTRLVLGSNVWVSVGCAKYQKLIKFAMDIDLISHEEMSVAVHRRLCQLGRTEYERCIKMSCRPNHATSQEVLGYAIIHELSDHEVSALTFDHGQTKYDYTEASARDLVKDVMHKITHHLAFSTYLAFSA